MAEDKKKKKTSAVADDLYLADWSEQMAQVLQAGLTPEDGLELLEEEALDGSEEKKILTGMIDAIRTKGELSEAMEDAGVFPSDMIRMVKLGERTGNLEQILRYLKDTYERQDALKKSIWASVIYPLGISLVVVGLICVILIFVMPVFQRAYKALGMEMTGLSLIFAKIGNWLAGVGLPILIAVFAVIFAVLLVQGMRSRKEGRIPFAGILRENEDLVRCRFAGVMALSFAGGMTAEEGLEMAQDLNDSSEFDKKIRICQKQMDGGKEFSDAVKESGIFTGRESRRIRIAEKTATLDTVMQEIADDLQISIDEETDRRAGRLEPILVVVLTVITVLILLSVMLPLLGVMSIL